MKRTQFVLLTFNYLTDFSSYRYCLLQTEILQATPFRVRGKVQNIKVIEHHTKMTYRGAEDKLHTS
jgi:hypothetical protein